MIVWVDLRELIIFNTIPCQDISFTIVGTVHKSGGPRAALPLPDSADVWVGRYGTGIPKDWTGFFVISCL